jgi:ankyrin repeat protein
LIHMGHLDAVQRCLSRENPSQFRHEKNFLQQTALHISINKPKILALLLSQGFADIIDVGDRDGTTALMYAAAQGERQSVLELLRNGADHKVQDQRNMLYTDYAMFRGHFDLFSDIFNQYHMQNKCSVAHWTLDTALYSYFYSSELSTADWSLAGLRNLLRLGANLSLSTKKGNTPLHFVSTAEQATLLLEFTNVSTNNPNAFGHTPLMVLSWFQDISIVRKLVELGENVDKRDNAGRTALEHALLARQMDTVWVFNAIEHHEEWARRFRIPFELLSAGANTGNTDNCECSCSPHGCTLVRCILPRIYSHAGRVYNLVGIPWVIELFLLLGRRSQSIALAMLIKSLYRRQRFDELGLMHTCCLAQRPSHNNHYSCPYSSAANAENEDEDVINLTDTIGVQRIEELADEEEELRAILEIDCERFEDIQELPYPGGNTTLLEILAQRAAFIKCGMEDAALKASLKHKRFQAKLRAKQPVSKYSHIIDLETGLTI